MLNGITSTCLYKSGVYRYGRRGWRALLGTIKIKKSGPVASSVFRHTLGRHLKAAWRLKEPPPPCAPLRTQYWPCRDAGRKLLLAPRAAGGRAPRTLSRTPPPLGTPAQSRTGTTPGMPGGAGVQH